jgi:ankyrin repeat protein
MKDNQKLLEKDAEDTRSLREPDSSIGPQTAQTFELAAGSIDPAPIQRRWSVKSNPNKATPQRQESVVSDEGYATGSPRSLTWSSILSRQRSTASEAKARPREDSDQQVPKPRKSMFHIPSIASPSTDSSEPFMRRWLSTSKLPDSTSPIDSFSGSSKKFWSVRLSRLNTRKSRRKPEHLPSNDSVGDLPHSRKSGQRKQTSQKIKFISVDGNEAPRIVRAAQAGSRAKVEAMLDNGANIEACHVPTKRTALAVACHCGNTAMVGFLINRAAKLNTRDIDLSTPLHLAASRGHIGAVELLLNESVKTEARDNSKCTPLWLAAVGGHTEVVELLLKHKARVKTRAKYQLTPLHAAARGGHEETVELLLRNNSHIESRDSDFMTALHYACENGHLTVADLLLRKGANVESIGKDSKVPLILAAASGYLQVVELLVTNKASFQSTDNKERNAMHWAAMNGHVEVAEFLLAQQLSVHTADTDGLTPLHLAVIGSQLGTIEFLLTKAAKVDARCRAGRTSLHYACDGDNPDIVRLLLTASANAEAETRGDNRRPIHIAAASGSVETIGVLYQHGVVMDAQDSAGLRPLSVACHYGHVDIVKTFLSLKQPLSMPFQDRPDHDSPLCVAAKAGHVEVVELLIRRGALVNERDECGFAPLRYAANHGHPKVLKVLIGAGAELLDDGVNDNTFLPTRDRIRFAEGVSAERKQQVQKLLLTAKQNMNSRKSSKGEQITDHGLIAVSELGPSSPTHRRLTSELPGDKPTTTEIPEKEVSSDQPLRSPRSIFFSHPETAQKEVSHDHPLKSARSKFSLHSESPAPSTPSSPTSPHPSRQPSQLSPPPPSRKPSKPKPTFPTPKRTPPAVPANKPPPPPPSPRSVRSSKSSRSLFSFVTGRSLKSQRSDPHLSNLVQDTPPVKVEEKRPSLPKSKSMVNLLSGGSTRERTVREAGRKSMMHIGELFVGAGEKKVDGKVEIVQEAGGQEVYEMA